MLGERGGQMMGPPLSIRLLKADSATLVTKVAQLQNFIVPLI
jgi:hypothetical protein